MRLRVTWFCRRSPMPLKAPCGTFDCCACAGTPDTSMPEGGAMWLPNRPKILLRCQSLSTQIRSIIEALKRVHQGDMDTYVNIDGQSTAPLWSRHARESRRRSNNRFTWDLFLSEATRSSLRPTQPHKCPTASARHSQGARPPRHAAISPYEQYEAILKGAPRSEQRGARINQAGASQCSFQNRRTSVQI